MNDNPSILTRRGFLRTMGLIVGAVVVSPAILTKAEDRPGMKQYDPDKVYICIDGKEIQGFAFGDYGADVTAAEVAATMNKELEGCVVTEENRQVTITSQNQGDSQYYEVLGGDFLNTSWDAVDSSPLTDIETMIRLTQNQRGLQ